jgi:hypothetical protein
MAEPLASDSEYSRVFAETLKEFPKFVVVRKSQSKFMKFLAWLLFFNKTFMTGYHTTIGNTLYVTDKFEGGHGYTKAALLRHERVHLRQQKRYTFLLYCVLYLLVLPVVFTFRAKLEKEAYAESIKAWFEYFGEETFTIRRKDKLIKQFTSGAYGWMCPFPGKMERWYDETLEKVKAEP